MYSTYQLPCNYEGLPIHTVSFSDRSMVQMQRLFHEPEMKTKLNPSPMKLAMPFCNIYFMRSVMYTLNPIREVGVLSLIVENMHKEALGVNDAGRWSGVMEYVRAVED